MKTDKLDNRRIIAEDGKMFRRISDGQIFGREIFLGYTYYIGGQPLSDPLFELPEHFEEIDEIITDETVLLNTVSELIENEVLTDDTTESVQAEVRLKKVTLSDYRELENKVNQMMNMLGINN